LFLKFTQASSKVIFFSIRPLLQADQAGGLLTVILDQAGKLGQTCWIIGRHARAGKNRQTGVFRQSKADI
jgi:hypothetical protein